MEAIFFNSFFIILNFECFFFILKNKRYIKGYRSNETKTVGNQENNRFKSSFPERIQLC